MKASIGKRALRAALPALLAGALVHVGPAFANAGPIADASVTAMKPFTQKMPDSELTFDLVAIPAGKFTMGSPAAEKGRHPDEGPQIQVQVDAFYMQAKAVSWDEYNLLLSIYNRLEKKLDPKHPAPPLPMDKWADAVTYPTPIYDLVAGPKLDRMGRHGGFPAVIMSQYAARQYTKWLSKKTGRFYRLPTEAEWEYAARAGTTTAYPFGDDIGPNGKNLGEYSWYADNSTLKDGDVAYRKSGSLKPNAWGVYDMHGNVMNWVIDSYDPDWYQKFQGKGIVNWHDLINWEPVQYPKIYRGGGYEMEAEDCRSAARHHSKKADNLQDPNSPKSPHWLTEGFSLGFRVVSPVAEPSEVEKLKFWDANDPATNDIVWVRDRDQHEILPKTEHSEKDR